MRSGVELTNEYKQKSTNDIAAEVLRSVEIIKGVALKPGRLQGPLQKGLKENATAIQAAITVLASRTQEDPDQHQ